ncbi:MAG: SMP-30/gluconolactonase/LRE family protein [Hyphomicrobiaceae bacterium]
MIGNVRIAFDTRCELGEGPLWLAAHGALAWCDILSHRLFVGEPGVGVRFQMEFEEPVSVVLATPQLELAVVSASGLWHVDIVRRTRTKVMDIEADNEQTRSNDGKVAPGGAIWIGTMGKRAEPGLGCLFHVSAGEVRTLRRNLTIPNANCFSPDGHRAYTCDTREQRILTCAIDPQTGLPIGDWEVFVDLAIENLYPDGATVDAEGYVWNAQWGAGRVARYTPDGQFDCAIDFPVSQVTCPAFGGPELKTLFVTSAWEHMSNDQRAAEPLAGAVFAVDLSVAGVPERTVTPWWPVDNVVPRD